MKQMRKTVVSFDVIPSVYARYNPKGMLFEESLNDGYRTAFPNIAYEVDAGWMFVTQETHRTHGQAYTVRQMNRKGEVFTVGQFNGHTTRDKAKDHILLVVQDMAYWN